MAEVVPFIPAALSVAQMVFGAKGTQTSVQGSEQAAAAARQNALRRKQEADFEAAQLDQNSLATFAASQREGMDAERTARLVQSRAIAVSAAGGGAVSDPTVVNILAKTAGEGAYRAGLALYGGESAARTMRLQAAAKRFEGDVAIEGGEAAAAGYATRGRAAVFSGGSTMLGGAASLFSKYGRGGVSGGGDAALIQPMVSGQFALDTYG